MKKLEEKEAKNKSGEKKIESTVPLVHHSRDAIGDGMLTDRQRTWMSGFPNDHDVENPVVCR